MAQWLDAEIIPGSPDERAQMLNLPVERSKQRFYHWREDSLSADVCPSGTPAPFIGCVQRG